MVGNELAIRTSILKNLGATTREAAHRMSAANHHKDWLEPVLQSQIVERIRKVAHAAGRRFAIGPGGLLMVGNELTTRASILKNLGVEGATTSRDRTPREHREPLRRLARSVFQSQTVERIRRVAHAAGRRFAPGPEALSWLAMN